MKPYYERDGITIYHADCREVLPTLAAGSVDLVLTDPPYGTTSCAWDSVIPLRPMWDALERIAHTEAAILLFSAQPFTSALVMSKPEWFRYEWVWEKSSSTGFLDANRRPLRCHENVCVFYRAQPTYNPQRVQGEPIHATGKNLKRDTLSVYRGAYDRLPSDLSGLRYPRSVIRYPKHSSTESLHPTQKPYPLMVYLTVTYSWPEQTVLDFACGSGTTLVAARNLHRKAIGIEIEERYCEIAARRLEQSVLPLAMAAERGEE
jgi:site-specific DNA-methyltransferase (adenine-specific)